MLSDRISFNLYSLIIAICISVRPKQLYENFIEANLTALAEPEWRGVYAIDDYIDFIRVGLSSAF